MARILVVDDEPSMLVVLSEVLRSQHHEALGTAHHLADDVIAFVAELRKKYGDDFKKIEEELRDWYKTLPKNHPAKKLSALACIPPYIFPF